MKPVLYEQVERWIGSDASRSDIICILHELINGEYEVEQMRKDVFDYADAEEEEL
jgi:hypothetical protein